MTKVASSDIIIYVKGSYALRERNMAMKTQEIEKPKATIELDVFFKTILTKRNQDAMIEIVEKEGGNKND